MGIDDSSGPIPQVDRDPAPVGQPPLAPLPLAPPHLAPPDLATLSRLLDDALDLPPAERLPWLARLPAVHAHLREALHAMVQRSIHGIDTGQLARLPDLDPPAAHAGDEVGPYRLLREIGRGGMGSVWLAERADGLFERQVALKLPRLTRADDLAVRLAREQRIAARLEHPHIARLYDAGLDAIGRPYIAMQLVDGVPIDHWCQARALSVPERLQLFVQVVRSVDYAHRRLVVHRDLKPGNVLVDAEGQAHLLDFGIAGLLQRGDEGEREPAAGGSAMTPWYAAPEQIAGAPPSVQADVYSLGVMLYELLTGTLPHAGTRERALPPPASQRVAGPASRAAVRELRGSVDAILAQALQLDPARRYATAAALADDIEHHLRDEAVLAHPDPWPHRLMRTWRQRGPLATAVAIAASALVGASMLAWVLERKAERAAEREASVKAFMAELLRDTVPRGTGGGAIAPAERFLERSASLADERLAGQPALQAELYAMVGASFAELGAPRLAAAYAQRRFEAALLAQAGHNEQAMAHLQWGQALLVLRDLAIAEAQARRALARADHPALRVQSQVLLARVLTEQEQFQPARELLKAIESEPSRGAETAAARAWVPAVRARLAYFEGRIDLALPLLDQAMAQALAAEGPNAASAIEHGLMAANWLAGTLRVAEATRYFEAAAAALQRQGGHHAIRAAVEAAEFASYRLRAGRQVTVPVALAEVARTRAQLAAGGWTLPAEVGARLDRAEATVHIWSGHVQAGLPLIERALPVLTVAAPNLTERRSLAVTHAYALRDRGLHEQADARLREVLQMRIQIVGPRHPYVSLDLANVATNLSMAGRHDEALALFEGAGPFGGIPGEGSQQVNRYELRLQLKRSRILLDRGSLNLALALFPQPLLREAGDKYDAVPLWGELLCASGQPAQGLPQLREALRTMQSLGDFEHAPWTARLHAVAGQCAARLGDWATAAAEARRARAAFSAQPGVSPYYQQPLIELERDLERDPKRRKAAAPAPMPTPVTPRV